MILKNEQGEIVAREEDPITREHIVNRLAQVKQQHIEAQQRVTDLQTLEKKIEQDLADYDKLVPPTSGAEQPPQDQNTNQEQDSNQATDNPTPPNPAPAT